MPSDLSSSTPPRAQAGAGEKLQKPGENPHDYSDSSAGTSQKIDSVSANLSANISLVGEVCPRCEYAVAPLPCSCGELACPRCNRHAVFRSERQRPDLSMVELVELVQRSMHASVRECEGCGRRSSCAPLWPLQRKCCPDCTCARTFGEVAHA